MAGVLTTRRATRGDIDIVALLFDLYRQFYRRDSDLPGARAFIADRLERGDSIILLAEREGSPCGFTQLYPSFTSTGMAPILILNDLYVEEEARCTAVGKALLDAAVDYGRQAGAVRLALSTATGNVRAQHVYEAGGWQRETDFCTYNFKLVD